ncbi:hypothetical protein KKF32_03910 [Patescibacteria group bacterium]|nr:hypothetical protein [Patescibacteria group bacterium]
MDFIYRLFKKKQLSQEAFDAYFNRLPDIIQVEWFRDGKFIIGKINAEGEEFLTQAFSAEEFVKMVNDTLLAVYEIPKEYFDVLLKVKRFVPDEDQYKRLNDVAIIKSNIDFEKKLVKA